MFPPVPLIGSSDLNVNYSIPIEIKRQSTCHCPKKSIGMGKQRGILIRALFTSTQNPKFFKISRHIECLDACMEY